MEHYNTGPFTEVAGEALEADRFVKLSAGNAVYADAGEEPIGVTVEAMASGKNVAIAPMQGAVIKLTASKAITKGAALYVANDGKASDAAVGTQIGISRKTTTEDGGKMASIVWGPRGGSDALSSRGQSVDYFDDFFTYDNTATVGGYAEVSDAGAIAAIDANNGVLSFATGATIENETYVSSLQEIFKFETDKSLYFEIGFTHTEANVDDANLIFGLSDNAAANFLQDAGAGPAASFDGAVFFKVLDGTVWQFMTSNAASQASNVNIGAVTDAVFTRLGFNYDYNDGVTAIITPYLNGVAGTPVNLTIAGLAEMHVVMGAKAGGANAETVLVDYVQVSKER